MWCVLMIALISKAAKTVGLGPLLGIHGPLLEDTVIEIS